MGLSYLTLLSVCPSISAGLKKSLLPKTAGGYQSHHLDSNPGVKRIGI